MAERQSENAAFSERKSEYKQTNTAVLLLTGALTGVLATIFTYPMDTLKTRMIVQPYNKELSAYKSYRHAFATIRSEEGWSIMFRGLGPTLTATVPSAMSLFFTYEMLSSYWYRPYLRQEASDALLQGICAAVISLCLTHPFDTIRRKMQAQSKVLPNRGGVDIDFSGAFDCYKQTVRQLRRQALWHGFFPALLRIAPFNIIMFSVYEGCKHGCIVFNGYKHRAAESHYSEQDIDDTDYFDEEIYHENIPFDDEDENDEHV